MTRSRTHGVSLCAYLTVAAFLAGCGGKTVTTSMQDQSLASGPPVAKKIAPTEATRPAPPSERAEHKAPPREELGFGKPGAMEEARVTEPVALPPLAVPAPTEASPAPPLSSVPAILSKLAGLSDVFFDYDRAAIRNDGKAALEANANVLKAENGWKLLISGHCDERGTLAYNLVLGERRAQAAKQYLADLGVPVVQIQVTSYGKEKPFCTEHSKDCWQKNRRAHLQVP